MNDLNCLARNVHEWPEGGKLVSVIKQLSGSRIAVFVTCGCDVFTREQWQTSRAELQNKPKECDCEYPSQCFEPCGQLGHDEEHAQRVEWNGEGLPPVGAQAKTSGGECTVMAVQNENAVCVQWKDGELGIIRAAAIKPLPTEEGKAVDEMRDLIVNEYVNSDCRIPSQLPDSDSLDHYLHALYRAGYRKTGG